MIKTVGVLGSLALLAAGSAWSGNGNMLHGFGPVNSSMGGAGAALWVDDPIAPLMFNPALIGASVGNHFSMGTEFFLDDIEIEVTLNNGTRGVTNPSRDLGVIPAFGLTRHAPDSRFSFGFGLIGIAGFRTDYPEDPDSILFAAPQNGGFGRIYTDHRVSKIPLAVAYQVTDKLTLGLAVNAYVAELAIAPLPYQVTDVYNGVLFYPQGDGLVKSYALSVQPSFYYQLTDKLSFGGSLTTEQDFDHFKWNSTFANPAAPNFGMARTLKFDLDGPLIVTFGAGYNVDDATKVALDVSWIRYDGVAGFGSPGGIVNGVVQPFGWDNVWAYKLGVEHRLTDKVLLRCGYNYSDIPIPSENTLTATGAPGFFKHHLSLGLGYQLTDSITLNLGAYYVPESESKGPLEDLGNNVIGTIKESNSLISGQVGLHFKF